METKKIVSSARNSKRNRKKIDVPKKLAPDFCNEFFLREADAENKFIESLTEYIYQALAKKLLNRRAKSDQGKWLKNQLRIFLLNAVENPKKFLQRIVSEYPTVILDALLSEAIKSKSMNK